MMSRAYRHSLGCVIVSIIICIVTVSCSRDTVTKGDAPTARIAAVAAAVRGKVYLIGGITAAGHYIPLVEEYDPLSDQWSTKSPMPTARGCSSATEIDGYIYVIGGRRDDEILTVVEKYDPLSDTWSRCSPMPTARWEFMAVAVNHKVYAIGGIAGVGEQRRTLDVVELYDPERDIWTTLGSAPTRRSNAAIAAVGDKVYVISGRLGAGTGSSTTPIVNVYDTARGVWSTASPLKQARSGSEACVLGSNIYVIGGAAHGEPVASIEEYDTQSDTWREVLNLRQARTNHNCAIVSHNIYVLVGVKGRFTSPKFLTSVEEVPLDPYLSQ